MACHRVVTSGSARWLAVRKAARARIARGAAPFDRSDEVLQDA
jgi:hypothetical protein